MEQRVLERVEVKIKEIISKFGGLKKKGVKELVEREREKKEELKSEITSLALA